MYLLFNSGTMRRTAFMVLLLWLFALGSGLANACLIQTDKSQAYGHGSLGMHSPTAAPRHAISVAREDTIRDHDSELDRSKSQCLKICDDGSQSLPKQRVSVDLTHPVLAPLPAVAWITAALWSQRVAWPSSNGRQIPSSQSEPASRASRCEIPLQA